MNAICSFSLVTLYNCDDFLFLDLFPLGFYQSKVVILEFLIWMTNKRFVESWYVTSIYIRKRNKIKEFISKILIQHRLETLRTWDQ